jgi:RND family efflux transporter MFP subunit
VTVADPEVRDVTDQVEINGTTEAIQSVEIVARVQGFLEQIRFQPSSFVRKGQTLFVIEEAPFIARRDRAKANLESAEAALRRAESDLARLEQAVKTNAVSQQEVTRARAERDQADAALLGARSELQNAEIELGYTTIKSPIDGLISRHLVDAGNLVGRSGSTVLATVRTIDPIYAYFEINERLFARMLELRGGHQGPSERLDDKPPATLILRETGHEVEGHLDSLDNTVDTSTGTIMLRGVFPNPDARIFPGFFVAVRIAGEELKDAIVIEERAVGTDLGGKYVYVVGGDDVVERRYVELGPEGGDGTIVILEGLDQGERYIVEGLLRARPGLPVTPKTATKGA